MKIGTKICIILEDLVKLYISSDKYSWHPLLYQELETLAHCSIKKAVREKHQLLFMGALKNDANCTDLKEFPKF